MTLNNIEAPFFTPIYDFISPKMVFGRIALVGDAASVGRPHTGYGVTKAACDALALARSLDRHVNDFAVGLAEFEAERMAVNQRVVRQGRVIGTNLIINASNQEEAKTENLPDANAMMRLSRCQIFFEVKPPSRDPFRDGEYFSLLRLQNPYSYKKFPVRFQGPVGLQPGASRGMRSRLGAFSYTHEEN